MHLSLAEAETLVVEALRRNRVSLGKCSFGSRRLVAAEAAGQGGHGLRRVPAYAAQAKIGKTDGFAIPQLTRPYPAVLRIDAGNGYAYPALDLAGAELSVVAREQELRSPPSTAPIMPA